jgi:hypothetical protein
MDEQSLIESYMDLTGASEACARGVFMYVVSEQPQRIATGAGLGSKPVMLPQFVETRSAKTIEPGARPEPAARTLPRLSQPLLAS